MVPYIADWTIVPSAPQSTTHPQVKVPGTVKSTENVTCVGVPVGDAGGIGTLRWTAPLDIVKVWLTSEIGTEGTVAVEPSVETVIIPPRVPATRASEAAGTIALEGSKLVMVKTTRTFDGTESVVVL